MFSVLRPSRVSLAIISRTTSGLRFQQAPIISSSPCFCNNSSWNPNMNIIRYKSSISNQIKELKLLKLERDFKAKTTLNYLFATVFLLAGCGFAAVPLFNAYCSPTNYSGSVNLDSARERTRSLKKVDNYEITITFNADRSSYLRWNFQPLQSDIMVYPGETVLAFYSAENPTNEPISGISTYNIVPYEAAKYFNKIQCFCFDEQRLNAHEQVDMPVFFYIDPDILNDPYLHNVKNITLSYTFFEAIESIDLPFMSAFVKEDS